MPNISYYSRDFRSIRTEIISFIKKNFPDVFNNFDDSSVGTMLIDTLAGVSESLSYNIDRSAQENILEYAQERASLMAMATTMGLRISPRHGSVTLCDFSVTVPAKANAPDMSYAPVVVVGAQVLGGGVVFETRESIDFASPYSQSGIPNRTIVPIYNNNATITSYTLTKREIVYNGRTKIFKKLINQTESKPFMEIFLPDADVLEITDLIVLDGDFQTVPSLQEWFKDENKWYEVESLAQRQIFKGDLGIATDSPQVVSGKWESITRKFITQYTDKGFMKIIFGGGITSQSPSDYLSNTDPLLERLTSASNWGALGEYPASNRTLFVKYRVGGGIRSNIGVGSFSLGDVNMVVQGANSSTNTQVKVSLVAANPIPAFGGRDELNIEEMRNLIRYNFSAQNRCVTVPDYYAKISTMPGKFGAPAKLAVRSNNGFIEVTVLGMDSNRKLTNTSTGTLKSNIGEYLVGYKNPNDYVVVKDGRIINIGFEIDLLVDKNYNRNDITTTVVNSISSYFDVNTKEMGENIYLSNLVETINNIAGVLNVVDIRVYNKVGGEYSLNESSQSASATTGLISVTSNTLLLGADEIFEVKYKDKDIKVRYAT